MIRKLIAYVSALPMLLLAHGAFAADLAPYKAEEPGPTVVFLTGKTCGIDCAAVESTVKAVAANHPEMPFRRSIIEDGDMTCLGVTAGPGAIVALRCELASGPGLSKFVDSQVEFAKRAQVLVTEYENAKAKLREAQAKFVEEARVVEAEREAALEPVKQKWEAAMQPIRTAWNDLHTRIDQALGDLASIKLSQLPRDQLVQVREKIAVATAPFAPEMEALRKRQIDALAPIAKEQDEIDEPFQKRFADITRRMYEATRDASQAVQVTGEAVQKAIEDNSKLKP